MKLCSTVLTNLAEVNGFTDSRLTGQSLPGLNEREAQVKHTLLNL
jgi:hypothetical protein